jgi:hypothetical protein
MNSKEFCEEKGFGEESILFAEKNPRLAEFWNNCNRYDWMLKLAHPDATNLRAFIQKLESELKIHKIRYTNPYSPQVPETELISQAELVCREYRRNALCMREFYPSDQRLADSVSPRTETDRPTSRSTEIYKKADQQLADWLREFCKLGR